VVAAALRRFGVRVGAVPWGGDAPHTDDARFEFDRAWACRRVRPGQRFRATGRRRVLGTGARPPARDHALAYARHLADEGRAWRRAMPRPDRVVVALDVPSGLDATTGDEIGSPCAPNLTLTFGTLKRGLLVRRDLAGTIAVLDIGLGEAEGAVGEAPVLYDPTARLSAVAGPIPAGAHKGTRGKVVVVGGAPGMAGAAILACDAALRSGAGMVRAVVAPESLPAVQSVLPPRWPRCGPQTTARSPRRFVDWADAVVLGPGARHRARRRGARRPRARGLARADRARRRRAQPLRGAAGGARRRARRAPGAPHAPPVEFARLAAVSPEAVLAGRFDVGRAFAARVGAAVLLKGVPTVVSDARGATVVASGTPALATAGSGDVAERHEAAALMVGLASRTGPPSEPRPRGVHGRAGEARDRAPRRGPRYHPADVARRAAGRVAAPDAAAVTCRPRAVPRARRAAGGARVSA
jgi:NAD(P)H-hydrate epimerase